MKRLIISLMKKKLFKNAGGGLRIPKAGSHQSYNRNSGNTQSSQAVTLQRGKGSYNEMHQGLKNLSIKPLKFRF